ncbi:uncharacterized protein LOC123550399 isoform X2 [Mercenaria mercenaria]|uniref:uncharacterized protein LOC123550399 isoform X2 n=1 Tax=Mercenaria mercenaria TaxID=6596 RepID=UPI00234EEA1B|nr:uncharacterized protein LOC123550399 isoform X2 [Mercenaria mercenaria]
MLLLLLVVFLSTGVLAGTEEYEGSEIDASDIKHVHLIFMNHLDVGYALPSSLGYLGNVLNKYFTEYFPRAIKVAFDLPLLGYVERFVYTTHPWLVSLYLDCPPNLMLPSGIKLQCPDAQNRSNFIDAINLGLITWHAGPMNMEFEMMDESMNEFGIQLSLDLDKRFGINRKYRTVSQRDVPGTTQAVIPVLKKMGISALSIGVNGATCPAAVPPVFLWKNGNQSLITLYHPRGYPNQYGSTPMKPGGLSKKDCAMVPGLDHALCFAFRSDNDGPPVDFEEVLNVYEIARAQFPNAKINASKFEDFVAELVPYQSSLPVFTQEMGDVWIQGAGSDPLKTALLRAQYRVRANCIKSGKCSLDDPRVYNASRFMLKLAEHTWGSNGGIVDGIHWTNDQFYKMLKIPHSGFQNASRYWDEQRYMTNLAIEALGNHTVVEDLKQEFKNIMPKLPDITDFSQVDISSSHKCGEFELKFDKQGALIQLKDPSGQDWATTERPVGKFVYRTYNQTDFDEFFNATTPFSKDFFLGIGKPNMTKNSKAESGVWDTKVNALFASKDSSQLVVMLSMVDPVTRTYYGAPLEVSLEYTCSNTGIDIVLQWFSKVPTRLPEGMHFVFTPVEKPGYKWWVNKIEDLIDPLNVVVNGSQRLHAINRGMYYIDKSVKGMEVVSLDAPIVNILSGTEYVSTLPLPTPQVKEMNGVSFNLYNNVWETNYIFWYPYKEEDMSRRYRFSLNFM